MASALDIGELRLRVEGSFTGTELRQLASKWGLVAEPAWDRSPSDLVRGLLKQADRMFGTAELVRRLRVEKPLVEWPDVDTADAEKWGPKSVTQLGIGPGGDDEATVVTSGPPSTGLGGGEAPDLGALELPESAGDGSAPPSDGSAAAATIAGDPGGAPQPTLDGAPAPSEPAPGSASAQGPASARRPATAAPFPGTASPAPEKAREGVDPKILVAVAGLMFGLAVVAFGAGLLWSRRASAPEGPKAAAAARPNAVAVRAVGVFESALLSVATRCEVDVDGPPTSEILAAAQEGCGRATRDARRRALNDASAPLPLDPARPRPREPKDADDPRPVRAPTAGAPQRPSCLSGCAGIKSSCMDNCGPEPGDASKFDVWQACSGRCLASESRCRLSCR